MVSPQKNSSTDGVLHFEAEVSFECFEAMQSFKPHLYKKINHKQNSPIMESLKALDNFVSCQRPVFSLGVSQHMHEQQICENFDSTGH